MSHLGYHSKQFADKVRLMDQTGKTNVVLSATEARNLLHDIISLQSKIVAMSEKLTDEQIVKVVVDNGKF